jgi:hypothetical protein
MTRPRILQPGQTYTFSKYFELPYTPADILAELGCSYEVHRYSYQDMQTKSII